MTEIKTIYPMLASDGKLRVAYGTIPNGGDTKVMVLAT